MLSKTAEGYLFEEFKYCDCKCGFTRPRFDNDHRERKRIDGHQCIGRKYSEETRKKMSEVNKGRFGENSSAWKADDVGYFGLHDWIRKNLPKKDFCEICLKVPPKEVACITGIYNREFKNWARMCIICHKTYDNVWIRASIKRRKKNVIKT